MKKFALSAAVAIAAFCFPLPAEAGAQKGWILTQKNDYAEGEVKLYVSPAGVKSGVSGYTTILRLQDGKVIVLDDEKKEFSESTFEEWKRRIESLRSLTGALGTEEPAQEAGSEKIAGLKAKKFILKTKGGEVAIPGIDLKGLGLDDELKMPDSTHEIWVTKEIPLSPRLAEFLKTTMGREGVIPPEADGMVLRLVTTDDNGEPSVVIDTVKCEAAPIDDALFEVPDGYKKVDGFMGLPVNMGDLVPPADDDAEE